MKNFNGFVEYSKKSCVKNNLIGLSIFILVVVFMIILLNTQTNFSDDMDNGMGAVAAIAIAFFLFILVTIITSISIPLFIDIYSKFTNNIKSLITLWSCDLIISLRLIFLSKDYTYSIIYLLFTILGSGISLTCKYLYIKKMKSI